MADAWTVLVLLVWGWMGVAVVCAMVDWFVSNRRW